METTTDRVLNALDKLKEEAKAAGIEEGSEAFGKFLSERHGPVVDEEMEGIRDQADRILEQHGGVGVAMLLGTLMTQMNKDVLSRAETAGCPVGALMAKIVDHEVTQMISSTMTLTRVVIGFESHDRSCDAKKAPV
jgi:hypothetical protein